MIGSKTPTGVIIGLIAILFVGPSSIFAQNIFNEADFQIKDFGIINGNPWLIVEGKAGGSTPQNTSTIYAYTFVTDNGTFAVMSHLYDDTDEVDNDTQWHTHRVTLDDKNCIAEINDNGDTEVTDLVKVTNVITRNVSNVFTAELSLNNADSSICVTKVFDSAP
ncbi:MAG TPA: hypothetical protein VD694_08375 [Nitrososphaeraceae archaeon]|nr:hypothetical protein [Nitrososphaeraceae archaeon]